MAKRHDVPQMLKCGGEHKFIVLSLKYLDRLEPHFKDGVTNAANKIARLRIIDGKDPVPEYIVINTDEPYIDEIIDVLKRHGHWGQAEEQR